MSHTPQSEPPGLARVLGPVTATAIVVGTIIGSGVFKKPATIAGLLPHSGVVAAVWILGGVLVILGALAYAEVCVLFPRTGGNYVFLREAYGRLAGFLWGWVDFWIIRSASVAALATIFAESLHDVLALTGRGGLSLWEQRSLTVAVILGLGAVNIRGVRWGGGLQVVVTAVKVGAILAIIVLPFVFLSSGATPPGPESPSWDNLAPVWPDAWQTIKLTALASAFLSVLWPYHGWMNLAPVAGEIRDPQRNIPLSLMAGVLIVVALYLGSNLAYYLLVPGEAMAKIGDPAALSALGLPPDQAQATTVASLYALRLLGSLGAAAAAAAVMCSVFGSLNGNLLVGPRLLFAMGEDGLAPRWLYSVHPRWGTPAAAIGVYSVWAALQVLAVAALQDAGALEKVKSPFDTLTDFAMFGAVIFETMAVLAIFRFRRTMPDAPRPYRCPGYPWVPALYTIIPAFVLVNSFAKQQAEAATGAGFIALGVAVYYGLRLQRPPAG